MGTEKILTSIRKIEEHSHENFDNPALNPTLLRECMRLTPQCN